MAKRPASSTLKIACLVTLVVGLTNTLRLSLNVNQVCTCTVGVYVGFVLFCKFCRFSHGKKNIARFFVFVYTIWNIELNIALGQALNSDCTSSRRLLVFFSLFVNMITFHN